MADISTYVHKIKYIGHRMYKRSKIAQHTSIEVIGIDTEAYRDGVCFMFSTSLGDTFPYEQFPTALFSRKYRNSTFVAYNLSYDEGMFIKWLPMDVIRKLWEDGKVQYQDYKIKIIKRKFLRITRGKKNSITFYDMLNFYRGAGENGNSSLNSVAKVHLGEQKLDEDTTKFTRKYVRRNWDKVARYCVRDAILVKRLADKLIRQFEQWGVYPRALYSVAYITYQYFVNKTRYVTVERFWRKHRMLLDYAMQSYNGGKFEVTVKGTDMYYEYDIVSAYPYEIANLIDISTARVVYSNTYDDSCTYAFLKCIIKIPDNVYSPVAWKYGAVNVYPVGEYIKVITKNEYNYLLSVGCDIKVIDVYHLYTRSRIYPYRDEILRLFEYKKKYKKTGDRLLYHTVKILLNSLYGKFVQLVKDGDHYRATSCWNPIYGSIITANTRIRVSEMQQKYDSIVAVHTDSVISTKKLPIKLGKALGDWDFETSGKGVILGSGVYQVGDTTKYRGIHTTQPLLELVDIARSKRKMVSMKSISWREVAFHGWDRSKINMFVKQTKYMSVRADRKRLWINDYRTFRESLTRKVYSLPFVLGLLDSVDRAD